MGFVDSPLISVLIPVYNAEKYLAESISSVLSQTFKDFEILILDDGSTDNSMQIVAGFSDPRIRLIHSEKNLGIVAQLNKGLSLATGKFIARMDADDICRADRFQIQLELLESDDTIAVCGSVVNLFGELEGNVSLPEFHNEILSHLLLSGNAIAHPTVMIRRKVLLDNNIIYGMNMAPAEDFELWTRIAEVGKLYNYQSPLLDYRIHDKNESVVKKSIQITKVKEIQLKLLRRYLGYSVPFSVSEFILSDNYTSASNFSILMEVSRAIRLLLKSDQLSPSVINDLLYGRYIQYCSNSKVTGLYKAYAYWYTSFNSFSFKKCLRFVLVN